jgi:hypothetical protein
VSEIEDLLDEAADLLTAEPKPGDRVDQVSARHARAEHLLLKAQLAILRQQVEARDEESA